MCILQNCTKQKEICAIEDLHRTVRNIRTLQNFSNTEEKMKNTERRDRGLVYISDDEVYEQQKITRRITRELNTTDTSDFEKIKELITELFGKVGENCFVNPPFQCDYGWNIEVGDNFFANYNCVFLDVGKIKFGDNCLLAPNVSVYTAGHPVHPAARNTLYEYGIDVTVGDNVWIGGNVVICPGVNIGSNSVIAAGSVVTRDIPEWSIAAGNPCRVIRKITEEDRYTYFRGKEVDEEAAENYRRIWAEEADERKFPTAP